MPTTKTFHTILGTHQPLHLLLASLAFLLLVVPALEQYAVLRDVGITVVFLAAIIVNLKHRRLLIASIGFAAVAVPTGWLSLFVNSPVLFLVSCIVGAAFFLLTAVCTLRVIVRRYMATEASVYGIICVYLLIGLAFAQMYSGLARVQPDAFAAGRRQVINLPEGIDQEVTAYSQHVYFSFVTMSTLGYGDIVPTNAISRAMCWVQSVVGQFFFAVLVARLISTLPHRGDSAKEPAGEGDAPAELESGGATE